MLPPSRAGVLALLLAACSAEPQPDSADRAGAEAQPPAAQQPPGAARPNRSIPALAVEGQGLRLFDRQTGSARPLAFGLTRDQVMKALAFRRNAETGRNDECGAGPLDYASWPDGLTLYFQHGRFVGWALDGRGENGAGRAAIATASNIGPGSRRADLERAYDVEVFSSTLGTEFAAGNLYGLLDGEQPESRITDMWAGASCNMR